MQVNQSALVGEYVADHICGFICYFMRHVTLGNLLFFIYNLQCRDLELVWVYFDFLEYSTIFSRLKDSFLS